jgi:hypothetical protein
MKKKNRRNNNNPPMQWTVQGQPMNNHQARRGTKRVAGAGCRCESCTRKAKPILLKNLKKEFDKDKFNATLGE